ncbi:FAD-binding oxidoreductase [Aeromicrobium erythreum]|uniref:FAD-binding oxidoreductase n=1 Tax=Aeromicrobium erythreum TaxID=2041 RepID=UPI00082E95EB|nr:FAD-dependent oxidoreductase [Aeromicrobium erythreum]
MPQTDEDWRGWNLTLDVPPALVVRPRTGGQVAAALRVADEHGWPVAVQATGHGASVELGRSILLDLSGLDDVELRPDTVVVGAGVRWRDVLPTVVAAGRVALCGSSPDVGVAGYLSGGGCPCSPAVTDWRPTRSGRWRWRRSTASSTSARRPSGPTCSPPRSEAGATPG